MAWKIDRPPGGPRRLRHLAVHGRHGREPAAAAEPAVLLRVERQLRPDDRRRATRRAASPTWCPGTTPTGNVRAYDPNLRPQFTQQYNVFVEYQLSSVDVGAGGLRREQCRPPGRADRGQPGAAGRRRPDHLGAQDARGGRCTRRSRSSRRSRPRPRARHADYNSLQASVRRRNVDGLEFMASYTLGKAQEQQPRLLRWSAPVREPRRAPTGRTPTTRRPNTGRRSSTCGTTSSSRPATSCRSARDAAVGTDWSALTDALARRLARQRHLPGAHGPSHHRHRRARPLAAGRARRRAAELRRRLEAVRPVDHQVARHQRVRRWSRSARSATARWASRGRPATGTSTSCSGSGSTSGATRYFEFRVEAFNAASTTRTWGRRRGTSRSPNTFGLITTTDRRAARDRAGVQVLLLIAA